MDSLFVIIKPLIHTILFDPEVIVAVLAIVTAILLYLKVPKWIITPLMTVLKQIYHAPMAIEAQAVADAEHGKVWTSTEKLDAAKVRLTDSIKTKKENKLLKILGGAEYAIEHIALPILQIVWKNKK